MLARRIIPCLDVKDGRVVKGVNFVGLRDAGDPIACAKRYSDEGADEITFLDISASVEGRSTLLQVVEATASEVHVPLTVGGGVRAVADVRTLLLHGADKVSMNTAALQNPALIADAAGRFGSQAIVVAIDAKRVSGPGEEARWEVFTHGGRQGTGMDALTWAGRVCELGCGEILLTSMDRDGTGLGYDLELTRRVAELASVPVIASGGVGGPEHLLAGFVEGFADAVLAATIFHDGLHKVADVKAFLHAQGVHVRLVEPQ